MTKPRYQDVNSKDIPTIVDDDGTSVRVLCGDFWGKTGPVQGIAADPRYLDISLPANTTRLIPIETTRPEQYEWKTPWIMGKRFSNSPAIVHLCYLTKAIQFASNPVNKAADFCWFRVNRSRNRSRSRN